MIRSLISAAALICLLGPLDSQRVCAQAGLRDSLEMLDKNDDGMIDPDEVTPLSRPYLERIAEARRMSLDRPNAIDKWQQAARIYHALQNGVAGETVRPERREQSIREFGVKDQEFMVPEFGLAEVKYRYTEDDLDEAEDTIRRYDRDRDGFLDRREAYRAKWTHRDPFNSDLNKDDKLSKLELTQRYARRRMLKDDSGELIQRARRTGNGIEPSVVDREKEDRRRKEEWWRKGGAKFWLTASVLGRFDKNRNGRLEQDETINLGFPAGVVDADQDGVLTRDELFAYLSDQQDQTGDLTEGLPGWFYELDVDRDKQVSLPEFATELTDARVDEFVRLDANRDGLLTPTEVLSAKSMTGGTFENNEAEILPPKKTIVSEIEIGETFVIADLNVRFSITHTHASALDAYLTGPDGQRIELFTEVGGHDDHFNGTILDDQSRTPITKARPPFEGTFIPEGLLKRGPGLSAFNGKSIEGVWQLTIRCSRSDRFGMLHSWALIARPDEESLLTQSEAAFTPAVASAAESTQSDYPQPSVDTSKSTSFYSSSSFWTPERKAEFAAKLKKPSSEEWEKMSDEERREKLEARKRAIEEYKKALGKSKGDFSKEGKR